MGFCHRENNLTYNFISLNGKRVLITSAQDRKEYAKYISNLTTTVD